MDLCLCRYIDGEHDDLETTIELILQRHHHRARQRGTEEVEMRYMIDEPIDDGILGKQLVGFSVEKEGRGPAVIPKPVIK